MHVAFIGAVIAVTLMVAWAGFSWFFQRTWISLLVISVAICTYWWSFHYANVLEQRTSLSPDERWHQTYLHVIHWTLPIALVIGCLVGFGLRQRAYYGQYANLEK